MRKKRVDHPVQSADANGMKAPFPLFLSLAFLAASCGDKEKAKKEEKKEDGKTAKVSFEKDIKPLFESSCLSCHNTGTLLGRLNLENRQLAFTEGDKGPFIVPGKPSESRVYQALILPKVQDAAMPPEGHRIEQSEIRVIHDWILQGAEWPEGKAGILSPVGTGKKPAA